MLWGLTSTRRLRRCCRESPASAKDWRAALSVTVKSTVLFAPARSLKRYRGWGPRLSSFRQDSCASTMVTIRSMRRAYTRRPIPWYGAFSATKSRLDSLIGNTPVLCQLQPEAFTDAVFGVPTVTDILRELEKPGRDPRPSFKTANFREGVEKLEDLKPGMVLEGVVTNVAAFGAFVDVGVHQDGLVHISAMANAYVKDPRKVAKPGDVVRVKVLEVDPKRRRISLTMRLDESPGARATAAHTAIAPSGSEKRLRPAETRAGESNLVPASGGGMAEAFRRAGLTGKAPGRR